MSGRLSSCLALGFLLCHAACVGQTTLTVAAAADLTSLESDLQSSFRKTDPNLRVRFVNGASALLSQQIRNGAPYDVFLSANAQFVDQLGSFGKLVPESMRTYAVGRLGVIWKDGKHHPFSDLGEDRVRFVALPNPRLAPYGVAAQQALEHAGIWKTVQPKVVYGENVRQTLELVETGNADAALTAASLLVGKNSDLVPAVWHQPIVQKAGIVAGSSHPKAARRFLDFLLSPPGQAIFGRFGFGPPTGDR